VRAPLLLFVMERGAIMEKIKALLATVTSAIVHNDTLTVGLIVGFIAVAVIVPFFSSDRRDTRDRPR